MLIKKYILVFVLIFSNSNSNALFKLIIPLYNETNSYRMREYIYCIEKNLTNKFIDEIHIIYDTSKDDRRNSLLSFINQFKNSKIKISYSKQWHTYKMCFDLANKIYKNKLIIISNTDIYFDETLDLLKNYDFKNKLLALTRWNITRNGTAEIYKMFNKIAVYSQDSWIFRSPCKKFNSDIKMGKENSDNVISDNAQRAGIKVLNPCLSIKSYHVHLSNIRNYSSIDKIKYEFGAEKYIPAQATYLI